MANNDMTDPEMKLNVVLDQPELDDSSRVSRREIFVLEGAVRIEDVINESRSSVVCESCGTMLESQAHLDEDADGDHYYCVSCFRQLVASLEDEAERYAREYCMITEPFPDQWEWEQESMDDDDDDGVALTCEYREECRDNCTNFEDLIDDFAGSSISEQIYAHKIEDRIEEMIDQESEDVELDSRPFISD